MTRLGRPRRSGGLLAVLVVVAGAGACGGDSDRTPEDPWPAVDLIEAAVDAVEAELGGPQDYYEINADERLVNLFVATDDGGDDGEAAVPYLYFEGELQAPAPPQPVAEGATFGADDLAFDPDTVLDQVAEELPSATLRQFVALVGPGGELRYEVFVQSDRGGWLAVEVLGDGTVLGSEVLDR